jgi:hypothetical protein
MKINSKELENLLINQGISLDEDIIDEDESAESLNSIINIKGSE